MTYKELAAIIRAFSEEQQNTEVMIFTDDWPNEVFPLEKVTITGPNQAGMLDCWQRPTPIKLGDPILKMLQ